jgi:pSer/pThr/pTyr-binding forkhead associated (FHA) protein
MNQSRPEQASERAVFGRTSNTAPVADDCQPVVQAMRLVLEPIGLTVDLCQSDQVLGRHSEADVRLPLPDVSRRHCRFVFSDCTWHVIDLDSLNGVFVNGERVSEAVLHDRDVLGIGSFRFSVHMNPTTPAAGAQARPPQQDDNNSDMLRRTTTLPKDLRELFQQRKAS